MASGLRTSLAADPAAVERAVLSSCSTEAEAKHFVEAVFAEPLEFTVPSLTTIPKATLVVGAGKLERAKFDDDLPKWVTSALRDLKFTEDRAASALPACAGTYKFQHDTGKNEKFVQVFPFVKVIQPSDDQEEGDEETEESLTGAEKAQWMCIQSPPATFKEMVQAKIGTWVCKKRVLTLLKEKDDMLQGIEEKLTSRVALTPEEQKLFDATDRANLEEKMQFLKGEMVKMVDEDKLSKQERTMALEQIRSRIKELEANGPPKQLESAKTRAEAVEKRLSEKGSRIPLKNEDKMKQLWRKTIPLEKLVEKAGPKGRWNPALSQAEIKALGDKEELEAEIQSLANMSRFWFEEEEELAARVAGAKSLVAGTIKSSSASKPSSSSSSTTASRSSAGAAAWTAVGKPSGRTTVTQAAKKPVKANAFAGLGDDSDSD